MRWHIDMMCSNLLYCFVMLECHRVVPYCHAIACFSYQFSIGALCSHPSCRVMPSYHCVVLLCHGLLPLPSASVLCQCIVSPHVALFLKWGSPIRRGRPTVKVQETKTVPSNIWSEGWFKRTCALSCATFGSKVVCLKVHDNPVVF